MKKGAALGIFMVSWAVIMFYLFVATIFFNVNPITLKCPFQIGHCYQMKDDNPFREGEEIKIKILDVQGKYVQYSSCGDTYYTSSSTLSLMGGIFYFGGIYKEIPCKGCK